VLLLTRQKEEGQKEAGVGRSSLVFVEHQQEEKRVTFEGRTFLLQHRGRKENPKN
jgi:hypothetical protein